MTDKPNPAQNPAAAIQTTEELMAHAYAIEAEAAERYQELAAQMEVHNNTEVAALFHKLAEYEGAHAREIESRAAGMALPDMAPWEFKWSKAEAPEQIDTLALHYLMSPQKLLSLALDAEQQAFDFFNDVASSASDTGLAAVAAKFAAEETEHIRMIEEMMERLGPAPDQQDDDMDTPSAQD